MDLLSEADLWSMGDLERSLWTARLFPVLLPSGPTTLDAIVWFLESLTVKTPLHHKLTQWLSAWRVSLKEILGRVDSRLACMTLREAFVKSTRATIAAGLEDCVPHSLLPTMHAALDYGGMNEMLETLDDGMSCLIYCNQDSAFSYFDSEIFVHFERLHDVCVSIS